MATGDLRITQLGKAAATAKAGVFPIVDPITDKTVQIAVQNSLGAVRANMDWQSDVTYELNDPDPLKSFVLFNSLVWQSLQNSNTGNIPTENTFWTEEPISVADGITNTEHANGVFTYEDSIVIKDFAFYQLNVAAPFKSSDFVTELGNDDWKFVGVIGIVDFIDFNPQSSEPTHTEGRIYYDDNKKNFVSMNDRTAVRLDMGREFWVRCKNETGVTITDGSIVQVTGVASDLPTIALAKADSLTTSDVLGWATEDIADNDNGEVTNGGNVNNIDTTGFTAGDRLFLSEITPGKFTTTIPDIPNFVVPIGLIVKVGASDGIVYARIGQIIPPNEGQHSWSFQSFADVGSTDNWIAGSFETLASFTPIGGGGDTIGNVNELHSAHAVIVLGASSTDMVVRIEGDSWNPVTSTVTTADSETIDTSGGVLDDYFETTKQWLGVVEYFLDSGTGVVINGGLIKYWENNDKRFQLTSVDFNGLCGKDDLTGLEVEIYEKKDANFAFNAAGAIFTPAFKLTTVIPVNISIYKNRNFNFELSGLSDLIKGDQQEGILFKVQAGDRLSIAYSNIAIQLLERRAFIV